MKHAIRRLILGAFAALTLLAFSGCAENERRQMRIEEEQHEGAVVEETLGEMVVE